MTELLDDVTSSGIVRFMDIPHATDLYLGELERKGRSPKTIKSYRAPLDALAEMYPGVDIGDVTTTMIRRFLDSRRLNARPVNRGSRGWTGGQPKAPGTRKIDSVAIDTMFDWLTAEAVIGNNPTRRNGQRILGRAPIGRPEDNNNLVSCTSGDVRRLLLGAQTWPEQITMNALAYLGPRRKALAIARITDFRPAKLDDEGNIIEPAYLAFHEKGGKTIDKPVPPRLADLIERARTAGAYDRFDYLVPPRGEHLYRDGDRDCRVIYDIVKTVAARVDVTTHVHALRAAFATFYLEQGKDIYDLQLLMGHESPDTTQVYARRLDKRRRMESVLSLDWGVGVADAGTAESPQFAEIRLAVPAAVGERGFEPLSAVGGATMRPLSERDESRPLDEALQAQIPRDADAVTSQVTSSRGRGTADPKEVTS